jgi:basic membrane lipoprotein Med (substrate-binding protein (PBP1-ABC) superfamily)
VLAAGFAVAACGSDDSGGDAADSGSSDTGAKKVKVGLILDGAADDGGWSQQWAEAAEQVEKEIPGTEITVLPKIGYGAPMQKAAQTFVGQGYDLVVSSSTGSDADIAKVAKKAPDTKFAVAYGTQILDNLASASPAIEEGRYLDGIIAGSATKSGTIGYVGGYPVPAVVRPLNSFTLGAHRMNPDVEVKALYVNSWFDPEKERQAAEALVGDGADVLGMDANSPAVPSVAKSADAGFIGYGRSRADNAPEQWLSTFTFNWVPYLKKYVEAIQNDSWKSSLDYWGLKEGAIGITDLGPRVPEDVKAEVDKARDEIISGELEIFAGPVTDNEGTVRVPDGEVLDTSDELLVCCDWHVEGVIGKVPKS